MAHYITVADASERLKESKRILVIGCSGGGKTTLSLAIAERFGLDYLSLDRDVRWLPGWQERNSDDRLKIIETLIKRDRWVMDGSNPSTFDLRFKRADLVLWVHMPRHVALWGLLKRTIKNYGKVRKGMAEGCPERIPDRAFIHYIWAFERRSAPIFDQKIREYPGAVPVAILRSRRDMRALLQPR